MPELAEVETVRQQIKKKTLGLKIKEVIFEEGDKYLFAFAKASDVKKALIGRKIKAVGRKGKYFWLELDKKPWPLFHLGMSGNISILKSGKNQVHEKSWGGPAIWKEDKNHHRRLWFCRLLIKLEKGVEIGFIDPRRFGRMWLTEDPWTHSRISQLGYDPLIEFPSAKELQKILSRRKKAIKAVLLDQGIFAGIGNWLADEILYHAKISPHHKASDLNPTQVKALREKTITVVKSAVKVGADYEKFPKNWLFHHRWGRVEGSRTSRQHKIKHETIGGRTSAWVPGWQK